jgi:hypothetical protein
MKMEIINASHSNAAMMSREILSYFAKLNNQLDELFYLQLFSDSKNDVKFARFNPMIMPETNRKIEMMDA